MLSYTIGGQNVISFGSYTYQILSIEYASYFHIIQLTKFLSFANQIYYGTLIISLRPMNITCYIFIFVRNKFISMFEIIAFQLLRMNIFEIQRHQYFTCTNVIFQAQKHALVLLMQRGYEQYPICGLKNSYHTCLKESSPYPLNT